MTDRRRAAAAIASFAATFALPGCAARKSVHQDERVFDARTGAPVTRAALLSALGKADVVLLGEIHDNPAHHLRRAELLEALQFRTVVAEHLPRGARVGEGADLLARLAAAGFDAKAWAWPLHEPVFAAALRRGSAVVGGNAAATVVRQVARQGPEAMPADLRAVLDRAPLSDGAQALLDADLLEGHCGKLPASRMSNMRWAQRARDAAMALTLRDAPRPAVLLAGNGHVRRDYGVPQLLAGLSVASVSVAFVEDGREPELGPYDFVWVTAAASREDPCGRL